MTTSAKKPTAKQIEAVREAFLNTFRHEWRLVTVRDARFGKALWMQGVVNRYRRSFSLPTISEHDDRLTAAVYDWCVANGLKAEADQYQALKTKHAAETLIPKHEARIAAIADEIAKLQAEEAALRTQIAELKKSAGLE